MGLSLITDGFRSSIRCLVESGDYDCCLSPISHTRPQQLLDYFTLTCPMSQKVIKLITAALLSLCPGPGWFTLYHPVSQLGHRADEVALGTDSDMIFDS